MLTRLKVSGFKNLVDIDVRFGPFTCIAGANGVGKSNLFDAIRFLSALADQPLVDAALSVRDEGGRTGDVRDLFHRSGTTAATEMSFDVEMIIPAEGVDDLGQPARATITFLSYSITLAYRQDDQTRPLGALELVREELSHINISDAKEHLLFPHSASWRKFLLSGRRTYPFISTARDGNQVIIKVHQDGGISGRIRSFLAKNLSRTIISASNDAESPTKLLARREMQSWRLLQLEPSSMRKPDNFSAPTHIETDGSHIASTLDYLASLHSNTNYTGSWNAGNQIYDQLSNRLANLISDIRSIKVERDEQRGLLTLFATGHDKTTHPAKSLSDGTLRFLALAILSLDPRQQGVICLEEPENGIHPERITAMLRLLQDIAVDTSLPIGEGNPLRQVIINTHSPAVVQQVSEDSLVVARQRSLLRDEQIVHAVSFAGLPGTWRTQATNIAPASLGELLAYLNPVAAPTEEADDNISPSKATPRVIDRPDIQRFFPIEDAE